MNENLAPPSVSWKWPDDVVFRGYAEPSRVEGHVQDLEVIGKIPPDLNGVFYRNSGDHTYPPLLGRDLFINGDGMVHMVKIESGHADLTTRYVRTRKFELERSARRALFGAYRNPFTSLPEVAGEDANTANTSMMWHHGKLYALKEAGRPYELDPFTLETRWESDFDGQLKSKTFTAHPKFDPRTGGCVAFAYNCEGVASDEIELYDIDREGHFTRTQRFTAPYCSMVHDFLVSENFIAFVIYPMVCDWERVRRKESYWHWDSHYKSYVAVIPRDRGVDGIRWFTVPKVAMQTHSFNAWEDGSKLVLDHFITESGWLSQFPDIRNPDAKERPPFGERWIVDLADASDRIEIRRFIEHIGEMPVIDPRFAMRRARHYWFGTNNTQLGPMLPLGPKGPPFNCLGHLDEGTQKLSFFYAGPDSSPEEPCFVPKGGADANEGDGWLLTIVGQRAKNRTDLAILDARQIDKGPLAIIRFPYRIREGIHGIWVDMKSFD